MSNLIIAETVIRCHALTGAFYTPTRVAIAPATPLSTRHMTDSGVYRIAGVVDIKGAPNVPVVRRVLLFTARGKRLIAETWSNSDGSYVFDCLAQGQYDVITYDHTGAYRAVIADNLAAEMMP